MRLARIGKRLMPRCDAQSPILLLETAKWAKRSTGARNFLDGSQGAFHTEGNMNLYYILILLLLHFLSQTKPHAPDEILL
jgi:hypothetical protein